MILNNIVSVLVARSLHGNIVSVLVALVALLQREIEKTQKEIIFTLAETGEIRSKETGNHVKESSGIFQAPGGTLRSS